MRKLKSNYEIEITFVGHLGFGGWGEGASWGRVVQQFASVPTVVPNLVNLKLNHMALFDSQMHEAYWTKK